jgi:hypothetical protein
LSNVVDARSPQALPTIEQALLDVMKLLDARLIRRGLENVPYLWRAYLSPPKDATGAPVPIGAFLHRFVSSDDLEYHCHPWAWSYAFVLEGSYVEDRTLALDIDFGKRTASLDDSTQRAKKFVPGDRNVIYASTFHRVELLTPEVWTFFVHGPRVQDWGFVPMNTFSEPVPMRLVSERMRDRYPKEEVR